MTTVDAPSTPNRTLARVNGHISAASAGGAALKVDVAPRSEEVPSARGIQEAAAAAKDVVKKPSRVKRWLAYGVMAAAVAAGGKYGWSYYQWSLGHVSTDNAFIDAHIAQVSARVPGHVARVYVEDNQAVHAGDVLVEIDAADLQTAMDEAAGKLAAAQADLTAAQSAVNETKAKVASAEASVAQARAEVTSRKAELQRAAADLNQYTAARDTGAVGTLEWGKADTAQRTAEAAVDAAQKAVSALEAQVNEQRAVAQSREGQVAVARAQIVAAEAAVEKARLSLSYTKITAPNDGRVTRKSVEPGNFIIPGQPLLALVSPEVWVTANFKETQLDEMKPGQKVEVEVDAYPGMKLRGHVDSIQQGAGARFSLLPPENATGNYVKVVQRVPVKIVLDEQPLAGDLRVLGPGMSVVPVVATK